MKRNTLCVLLLFCVAALSFAGGRSKRAENATVSGSLSIVHGIIAVKNNDTTWYLAGIGRYIGFIDGLKEGASVTLQGPAINDRKDAKAKWLRVEKLAIGNREYDLSLPESVASGRKASYKDRYW